jgi:hypothetical protein
MEIEGKRVGKGEKEIQKWKKYNAKERETKRQN